MPLACPLGFAYTFTGERARQRRAPTELYIIIALVAPTSVGANSFETASSRLYNKFFVGACRWHARLGFTYQQWSGEKGGG